MKVKDYYQLDYWRLDGTDGDNETDKEIRTLARSLFPSDVVPYINSFGMLIDAYLDWNYPDGVMEALSLAFP